MKIGGFYHNESKYFLHHLKIDVSTKKVRKIIYEKIILDMTIFGGNWGPSLGLKSTQIKKKFWFKNYSSFGIQKRKFPLNLVKNKNYVTDKFKTKKQFVPSFLGKFLGSVIHTKVVDLLIIYNLYISFFSIESLFSLEIVK